MALMNWDQSLDVGEDKMNHEHQDILKLMNDLHDAWLAGKTGSEVLIILRDLVKVTTDHFADEEVYMQEIGYASLATHKMIHADLLKKLNGYYDFYRSNDGQLSRDFFSFLKLWLTAHIKGVDMKYAGRAKALREAS